MQTCPASILEMLQCCHIVLCYEVLDQKWPVCWGIVMEKPTVGSPFFRAFPSDRIPKATKDGNVHFFIHSFTFRDELIIVSANSENFLKLPRTQCCQFKGDGYRQ